MGGRGMKLLYRLAHTGAPMITQPANDDGQIGLFSRLQISPNADTGHSLLGSVCRNLCYININSFDNVQ